MMPDLTKPLADLEEKWQTHGAEDMDIPTLDYCASELHAVRARPLEAAG